MTIPSRHEAATYLRAVRSHPSDPGTRTLIFGQGRSGSTLLEPLLASTGHVETRLRKVVSRPLSERAEDHGGFAGRVLERGLGQWLEEERAVT